MAAIIAALSTLLTSTGSQIPSAGSTGPWRPPQWSNPGATPPALTLTATDPTTNQQTAYVFDTVRRIEHSQGAVITENPVQTGAAITDHAFRIPARVLVEILMSDSMQSYTVGQWSDSPSKSVSAFQKLIALQAARSPMQLATRLRNYSQMLISNIVGPDDERTRYGLRCLVTFTEIITANVAVTNTASNSINNSARPQSTAQTTIGQTTTQPVPASITSQNDISNASQFDVNTLQVPAISGAGAYSSYPTSNLNNFLP